MRYRWQTIIWTNDGPISWCMYMCHSASVHCKMTTNGSGVTSAYQSVLCECKTFDCTCYHCVNKEAARSRYLCVKLWTHQLLNKMAGILKTIFSNSSLWEKWCVSFDCNFTEIGGSNWWKISFDSGQYLLQWTTVKHWASVYCSEMTWNANMVLYFSR